MWKSHDWPVNLPRPEGRSFGAQTLMPGSTLHNAEFLFHGTPNFGGSSAGCDTVGSTAEDVTRGVHIGVRRVSARATLVTLAIAALFIDHAAFGAPLRGVRSGYFDDQCARFDALVLEHPGEARPTRASDALSETATNADHVLNAQRFENDNAVAIGVALRFAVQNMIALAAYLSVSTIQTRDGSRSILRSFLPTRNNALCTRKMSLRLSQMARVFDDTTIGIGEQVDASAIDSDSRLRGRERFGDLLFAGDRGEPLIAIAFDDASFRFADERSVNDDAHRTDLWEVQYFSVESPHLRVGLSQPDHIASFTLPFRRTCESLETALPSEIQIGKELGRDVARHVGEPRQFGAQSGQLVHLVESRRIVAVVARVRVGDESLLVRKVPEEPEGIAPAVQPRGLFCRRVDAVAKALTDDHEAKDDSAYAQCPTATRRGYLLVLNGVVSTLEIR